MIISARSRPISIHAPIRGRHFHTLDMIWCMRDFNPRPHTGATLNPRNLMLLCNISIHAPIRGRPRPSQCIGRSVNFNPRPHTGATSNTAKFLAANKISIHAPIRGRPSYTKQLMARSIFQSTPPYGGDCQTKQFDILRSTLLVSRKSFPTFPKPHPRVLFLFVCFPFALAEPSGQTEFYLTSMQTRNPLLFYHF